MRLGILAIIFLMLLVLPVASAGTGKITFVSNRDSGNYEIYRMNPDGTSQTRLTNNPAYDVYPAWSPDGSKIAFQSNRDGSNRISDDEIYVMNPDGTGQTPITNNPAFDDEPAYSPDGKKIAFVSQRDLDYEIYVMNADGSGQTRLTRNPDIDDHPSYSPDGRKIAFSCHVAPYKQICIMNEDGTGHIPITNTTTNNRMPDWSPDGSKIAFVSFLNGDDDICVMNADGSEEICLTNNLADDSCPAWSPDGTMITFASSDPNVDYGNREIYVMNADGSGQTRITNNTADDWEPDWGPGPKARNVSQVYVFPYGYLPTGTPVTAVFTINVVGVYPADGEERLFTELENPNWTYTIVANGIENLRPVIGGSSLTISGFELNYRPSDTVSVHVELRGNAPALDPPSTNFTVVQIQSIDGNNNIVPDSLVTVEGQTVATHPPETNFTGHPTSGTAPHMVFFWDISTNYPSSWNWSFGDGTLFNYSGLIPLNPIHTYYRYGTYTVSLTTTNDVGSNTTTKTGYITVTNATTQIGVVRNNSTWILDASGNGAFGAGDYLFTYGKAGDVYVNGNWDNDNLTEIGVVRNKNTWLLDAGDGTYGPGDLSYTFGKAGDAYVTGNWNNDSKTEIGIVRNNSTWVLDASGNGAYGAGDLEYTFGKAGDLFVTGDWDANGRSEIGIVRDGTSWVLDSSGDGAFGEGDLQYAFGKVGDAYVTGDWNADGKSEIGVVRNGTTWLLDASGNGMFGAGDLVHTFGKAGDVPVIGNWARPIPQPSIQPTVTITFNRDLTITPGTTVEIPVGGKVIWKNDDPFKPHGIVAADIQTGNYFGGMNPVSIPYGNIFEVTFDTLGSFNYTTIFQPETGGTVMVI